MAGIQRHDSSKLTDLSIHDSSKLTINKQHNMIDMLLGWNIDLTIQGDQNGSTPLHFSTSALRTRGVCFWMFRPWFLWNRQVWHSSILLKQVLHANLAPLYQPDDKGFFPIHIAANIGANEAIIEFLEICPNIAGLRDMKGITFLHLAVKKEAMECCRSCMPKSVTVMDFEHVRQCTPLHLSVKHSYQNIFSLLLENLEVHLNLLNNNGETPLDLSESMIAAGSFGAWNPRFFIDAALKYCHAKHGNRRLDHFEEQYIKIVDEQKHLQNLINSTQTLGVGSVLMTTAAFAASFTLPGGYKDDGTPVLSGRYVFYAFIAANSLAFGSAGLSTINIMYSGTAVLDVPLRSRHFLIALYLAFSSVTSLATAFVLGLYLMLASVTPMTATAICVVASTFSVLAYTDSLRGLAVARALRARMGNRALVIIARIIVIRTAIVFWPLVASFIWAEISTKAIPKVSIKPLLICFGDG
ncbi:hypothetical protein EJB05_51027, partial [Eragrostis curvula]